MPRPALFAAFTLAGLATLLACTPRVYECESDDNCISRGVQGVCQDAGFCSYPDEGCDSGQRYDEFAGDGLARDCVGGSDDEGTATGACEPADCIDADGDGYGVGAGCSGADCDDDNPAHADRCVYVAPGGDDTAAGTVDAPWGTIERALGELTPGTSLVLLDGVYGASTTGLLNIHCEDGGNAANGTADAPIGVRAANERAAELVGGGAASAIRVAGCTSWRLTGLRATGGDLLGSEGGVQTETVSISGVHDLVVRRLLAAYNNRIFNTDLVGVQGSTDVLFEDAEAYFFHRSAFLVYESDRVTFRRCYTHSRGHADLPDCTGDVDTEVPFCSSPTDGGDAGFAIFRDAGDITYENCIVDGRTGTGFSVGNHSSNVAVRGSIVLGDADYGVIAAPSASDASVVGTTITDALVLAPRYVGVFLRSTTDSRLDGVSIVRSQGTGFTADQAEMPLCSELAGGCSVTARRVLALANAESGISITDQDPWQLDDCDAFGNGTDYPADEEIADDLDRIRHSFRLDADIGTAVGECAVYVPQTSAVHGIASDGSDIGATILWRLDGTPTDVPLWDPDTGAFPCGAIVEGLNDDPTASCVGVHTRLNVFTNGCERPPDYPTGC